MSKYLLFMCGFLVFSCASFNSPYKGRVISSIEDPSFVTTIKEDHIYIKTTYKLAQKHQGIHSLRIPLGFNFTHHSASQLFGHTSYSFMLSGKNYSCTDESVGFNKGKLLMNNEYEVNPFGLYIFDDVQCRNDKDINESNLEITFKIPKSNLINLDKIQSLSLNTSQSNYQNMPEELKTILAYHFKYLKYPSRYSDQVKFHKKIGSFSDHSIEANKYGYQYSKQLKKNQGLIIYPPQGEILYHKKGLISSSGSSAIKTKSSFLSKKHTAFALICRVQKKTGSTFIYDFSKYPNSKLIFNNEELIECGINQPNKKRRLRRNTGHLSIRTSLLDTEITEQKLKLVRSAPQEYVDNLVNNSNKRNIDLVRSKFNLANENFQAAIQSEYDIQHIAPLKKAVQSKSNSVSFVFKPSKTKVIHEDQEIYFIDYDVYLKEQHTLKSVYNSYTESITKDGYIYTQAPLKVNIKTDIKFDKEREAELLKVKVLSINKKDKRSKISQLKSLALEKYIKESDFMDLIESGDNLFAVKKSFNKIELNRSSVKVCADLSQYTYQLPRGTVQKGQIIFNKVQAFYNHKHQMYKTDQVMHEASISPVSFKTTKDLKDFKHQTRCFEISSQDLAQRNFKELIKRFK